MSDLIRYTTARKQTLITTEGDWLDGGSLVFYNDPVPETGAAITTQTALCTAILANPAGTATDGVWTSTTIDAALITASGDATWARAFDSLDAIVGDLDVGAIGSGAALEIDDTSLTQGGYLLIASFTLSK